MFWTKFYGITILVLTSTTHLATKPGEWSWSTILAFMALISSGAIARSDWKSCTPLFSFSDHKAFLRHLYSLICFSAVALGSVQFGLSSSLEDIQIVIIILMITHVVERNDQTKASASSSPT